MLSSLPPLASDWQIRYCWRISSSQPREICLPVALINPGEALFCCIQTVSPPTSTQRESKHSSFHTSKLLFVFSYVNRKGDIAFFKQM